MTWLFFLNINIINFVFLQVTPALCYLSLNIVYFNVITYSYSYMKIHTETIYILGGPVWQLKAITYSFYPYFAQNVKVGFQTLVSIISPSLSSLSQSLDPPQPSLYENVSFQLECIWYIRFLKKFSSKLGLKHNLC